MEFTRVIEQYHAACHAFATGDPAPVKSLYAHSDDVLLANAFGGSSRGWRLRPKRLISRGVRVRLSHLPRSAWLRL